MQRRSGLGRGLDALIPTTPAANRSPEDHEDHGDTVGEAPRSEARRSATAAVESDHELSDGSVLRQLPLSSITAGAFQPRNRFEDEALEELTASISELGVLQPVLVRPSGAGYELIAGERRWRAAKAAGLTTMPALIRTIDDATALEQALVENLQRDDLTPLEEAAAYQQLQDEFGCTQEDVARKVGRSRAAVTNTLRLLQLPMAVQRLVNERLVSAGHARALLALPSADAQELLAARVVDDGWSVRQTEAAVRRALREVEAAEPTPATGAIRSAGVLEVEQQLGDHLGTRVRVQLGAHRGKIQIDFADIDDLSRLYTLLMGETNLPTD